MLQADRLRNQIILRGVSQAELARRVGISQQTIARLASGEAFGSRYLHQIARELGTTPAYLTGETDDPTGDQPHVELTSEEREWVELLRTLPTPDRKATVHLVRSLANCARSAKSDAPQLKKAAV